MACLTKAAIAGAKIEFQEANHQGLAQQNYSGSTRGMNGGIGGLKRDQGTAGAKRQRNRTNESFGSASSATIGRGLDETWAS